jgi:6-pyruvoyltetrahydropterin/6-carboxytetrahydropterin synthase
MFLIRKEFHFSASHQLFGLPTEHPCSRVHGHNYVITVELQDIKLNQVGFVTDYRDLEPMKKWIDETLDHQHLNDVLQIQPSAENLAKCIFEMFARTFPQLIAVEVSETPKTTARYTPNYD